MERRGRLCHSLGRKRSLYTLSVRRAVASRETIESRAQLHTRARARRFPQRFAKRASFRSVWMMHRIPPRRIVARFLPRSSTSVAFGGDLSSAREHRPRALGLFCSLFSTDPRDARITSRKSVRVKPCRLKSERGRYARDVGFNLASLLLFSLMKLLPASLTFV